MTEEQGILNRLNRMSLRNKVIAVVVIIFIVLLLVSIPSDRGVILDRQERVESAQIVYDLALPTISPVMLAVKDYLDNAATDIDLSGNRDYTQLERAWDTVNRDTSTPSARFRSVVTFSENVHDLLEGSDAVEELDTEELRDLVLEMDTTLSVAWLALMELNTSVDEYNGYQNWLSAKLTSALFGLPTSYPDPISSRDRLMRESLELEE